MEYLKRHLNDNEWSAYKEMSFSWMCKVVRFDEQTRSVYLQYGGENISDYLVMNPDCHVPSLMLVLLELYVKLLKDGICHGDFHCSNILIQEGQFKVIDFEFTENLDESFVNRIYENLVLDTKAKLPMPLKIPYHTCVRQNKLMHPKSAFQTAHTAIADVILLISSVLHTISQRGIPVSGMHVEELCNMQLHAQWIHAGYGGMNTNWMKSNLPKSFNELDKISNWENGVFDIENDILQFVRFYREKAGGASLTPTNPCAK